MRYLLDTHILLWALQDSDKLPQKAREIISSDDNHKYFSTVSIWETAIKHIKRPDMIGNISPQELVSFCEKAEFLVLPLTLQHVFALQTLTRPDDSPPHNDPFDRMLIAQAKSENMIFLTHDELLSSYNEPCIITV